MVAIQDDLLHKQTIEMLSGKDIKAFLGVGFLNGRGEVSEAVPFDFLIFLNTIRKMKQQLAAAGGSFSIDIFVADINAKLQIQSQETEDSVIADKLVALDNSVTHFQEKLDLWSKNLGIDDAITTSLGSTFCAQDKYLEMSDKLIVQGNENLTPYALEQLRTMKMYKELGYDYRISWVADLKKPAQRDERYFDELYKSCLSENPLQSIYTVAGKKVGGLAVPYSYYKSEEGARLTLDRNHSENEIDLLMGNKKYAKHCASLLPTCPNSDIVREEVLKTLTSINSDKRGK